MSENKKQLKDMLFNKKENGVDFMTDDELRECDDFCEGYKEFLGRYKTEREVAVWVEDIAQANGFQKFDEFGESLEGLLYEPWKGYHTLC